MSLKWRLLKYEFKHKNWHFILMMHVYMICHLRRFGVKPTWSIPSLKVEVILMLCTLCQAQYCCSKWHDFLDVLISIKKACKCMWLRLLKQLVLVKKTVGDNKPRNIFYKANFGAFFSDLIVETESSNVGEN